tara:strand:- start:4645 stop:5187 length:543 start_codon:yes stop_codon:yes gene_type:complete
MYKQFNEIYHFISKFKESDLNKLNSNISLIYRNYDQKVDKIFIKEIHKYCKKTNRKLYLANNFNLAYSLGLDGAYIPSFNKSMNHNFYNKRLNFKIIGSAHNIKEIIIKEKQNVEYIFISPLFKTKKYKSHLGLYKFINLKKISKKKIVPLGGINKINIKMLKILNCNDFAAISFINKNS